MAVLAEVHITITKERDVEAVHWFYLLQSSTASAPDVPTVSPSTLPASTSWTLSEPTYTEGSTNSLYIVECTVFTDGTWTYSDVSLSSSYEAAKAAYNKAVNAGNVAANALEQTPEYIVGSQTAKTNAWTGVTTKAALYKGMMIMYKLPYACSSSSTAVTLNLTLSDGTTTGAKKVYRMNNSSGTSTLTSSNTASGMVLVLVYDGSYWRCIDINTDTTNRVQYSNAVLLNDDGTATPYIMVGEAAGYKIAAAGVSFDISYPVLCYSSSTDIVSGNTTTAMYTMLNSITLQNNVASWTGTQYSMVYLVGTLSGSTFTIDEEVFTTEIPTTEDRRVYIPIGVLYSTYQVYFKSDQTIYAYGSNGFGPMSQNAQDSVDDIIENLASNYYDKTDMDASLQVLKEGIYGHVEATYVANEDLAAAKSAMEKSLEDTETNLSEKQAVTDANLAYANSAFAAFKKKVEGMLTFDLDENGVPTLAIQSIVDGIAAPYAMKMQNTGYSVEYEGSKVAYMDKQNFAAPFMKTKEVHFAPQNDDGSLGTASAGWVRRQNGHTTFKNFGGDS